VTTELVKYLIKLDKKRPFLLLNVLGQYVTTGITSNELDHKQVAESEFLFQNLNMLYASRGSSNTLHTRLLFIKKTLSLDKPNQNKWFNLAFIVEGTFQGLDHICLLKIWKPLSTASYCN